MCSKRHLSSGGSHLSTVPGAVSRQPSNLVGALKEIVPPIHLSVQLQGTQFIH